MDRSEANNPQTQKGAYRRKTIGLQIPSSNPGAADLNRPLLNMGTGPPAREAESEPEPGWRAAASHRCRLLPRIQTELVRNPRSRLPIGLFSTSPHRFGAQLCTRRRPRAPYRSETSSATGFLYVKARSPAHLHASGSQRTFNSTALGAARCAGSHHLEVATTRLTLL